ncbi:ATP-binding cassette sub-family G member 4-like [Neocloeon triangulifer]|uniref:ATP-binding cassette sub-family G member 4-like n=1 Tax=Neocloeon triangulifer TaxID=2078957 RepID=UPI00286F8EC8|nr:ATP-binding cassette sub-family G member 4-like [Neocloeon triangulifer]
MMKAADSEDALPAKIISLCDNSNNSEAMEHVLKEGLPDLLHDRDQDVNCKGVGIWFEGISLTVRKPFGSKKEILTDLSGHFPSGKLSAIIGPSGAGKSSLLSVLAGRQRPTKGSVTPRRQRRRLITQTCFLPEVLTAHEALSAAAALKLNAPSAVRRAAVRRVLAVLSLSQSARTPCSALSGGQRKRLSIALELIDEPPVLILDEPTTGLDCVSGLRCMRLLQRLSRSDSRTIVCTIHQPSARLLDLLDFVYLLAAGRCIYKGPVDDLLPTLAVKNLICPPYHNPADFALDVACGEYGTQVVDELALDESKKSGNLKFRNESGENGHGPATSFFNQFFILTWRSLYIMIQEKSVAMVKIVVHLAIAIVLGILFFDIGNDASRALNNASLLVCIQIFLVFTGLMPTILTFPMQKAIFKNEFSNCWYSMEAHFLSTFVSNLPLPIFNSVLFSSIVYWMSGQPPDFYIYFINVLTATLTCLNAQSIGWLIGTVAGLSNGMFLAPLSGVPQFLFCGYFIALSTCPMLVKIIAYSTSYTLYSFHAGIATIYGRNRPKLRCDELYCHFRSPIKLLEFLDTNDEGVEVDLAALFIFMTVINLLTYLVMKFKYSRLQK